MSTDLAPDAPERDTPVPITRLVVVEMRKMVDTRAGFWLLLTIALLTAAATTLFAIFGPEEERGFEIFLLTTGGPQGFLLPVLGVLLVTSEWGQRAALVTFTLVPRRGRILVAKVVAALLLGTAAVLLAFALAALATALRGGPDPWENAGAATYGHFLLLQALGVLQGVAFGMLLLNSAAAIVSYFVLPIVSSIVFSTVPQLASSRLWVDAGSAQAELSSSESLTGTEWAHVLTTTLIWVVLPLALGAWRVLRTEVK